MIGHEQGGSSRGSGRARGRLRGGDAPARGWAAAAVALLACNAAACTQLLGPIEVERSSSEQASPLEAGCGDAGVDCSAICDPGAVRCTLGALERCDDGGREWLHVARCESAALCDAELGMCSPPACGSGQHRCTERGELLACNGDRTGFELVEDCGSAALCNTTSGREGCDSPPCRAGRQRCNGAQIEECRQDGTGFDPVGAACVTAWLCVDGESDRAYCDRPACDAGQMRCTGALLERCADERNGFVFAADCESESSCDAAQGRCVEAQPPEPEPPPPVVTDGPYTFVDFSGPAALGLGPMNLELPAQWTDVDTRAWTTADGQALGPRVVASTDAARFARDFDIPGVYFAATAQPPLDIDAMQARFDMSARCTRGSTEVYYDGLYSGSSQTWLDCGATQATNVVVVAMPFDERFVTVVIVTLLADRDRTAMQRILDSFLVE